MSSHQPTEATASDDPDTAERDRVEAMFKMLATAEDVARMMAGVKQQFITEAGYSPENAEQCAVLLWKSSLQVHLLAASPAAAAQPDELARANAWIGNVTRAARELLAALQTSANGWRVASQAAFTAAVDSLMTEAGITTPPRH